MEIGEYRIMALISMNFLSRALNMQTNVSIVLPTFSFDSNPDFSYQKGNRYQVLYLLHGGTGDNYDYIHNTNVVRYAEKNKVAVVMPCNYNMAYTDDLDGYQYFTYIVDELPTVCSVIFPISDKPEDTFIGGLSMGSHGAMKAAILYPDRYAAALIMSGASFRPGVPIAVKTHNGVFNMEESQKVPVGMTRRLLEEDFIRNTPNDIYQIAKENGLSGKKLPKLYFRVGDCDHALYRAQRAVSDLIQWGYDVDFEVMTGYAHDWDLWDRILRESLSNWFPLKRRLF